MIHRLPLPLPLLLVVVAGCKREAQREPRADRPVADAPIATARDAAAAQPPDPDLPPPSQELGAIPDGLAAGVKLEVVAENLARPVLITFAPGDPRRRLFVVEQHEARIKVIEGGAVSKQAFFDLQGKVATGNEQGLLGLAFHPDFIANRKLYVSYNDEDGDTHVDEYQASATDPDQVDLATRRALFFLPQPYSNHNGGHVEFGPDGKLYLGLGDGGSAGDPKRAGQDPDQLLAKMLRFDVDAAKPEPEVVATGLRNPWRFDFDSKTGDIYIGDVGQDEWESVYAVAAGELDGKNFGWSVAEGRHCYRRKGCDRSAFVEPVADYPREQGCSVTGGVVYRGAALPALDGVYFYGEYCLGWIRSFRWRPDGIRQHWDWRSTIDPSGQVTQISSFGVDEAGEVYVVSLTGTIWKLAPR